MSAEQENPLLAYGSLPAFSLIRPEHAEPAIALLLNNARQLVAALTKSNGSSSWASLIDPIAAIDDQINQAWSPVNHLHAVADTPELRKTHKKCLEKLSKFTTELNQNKSLFNAYKEIQNDHSPQLNDAQQKTIDNEVRNFELAGVTLDQPQRDKFKSIVQRLSELSSKFEENLLDATQGWKKIITDHRQLSGLPETTLEYARNTAKAEGVDGWVLTLEAPSYLPALMYLDDPDIRKEIYESSTTRASDRGPNAGIWDNTSVIEEILHLRHEQAQLLGFNNFAEYSLSTKMAQDTDQVVSFLDHLSSKAKIMAEEELDDLRAFVSKNYGINYLDAWDIAYYSEKLRKHRYDVNQENLRPYFPVNQVLSGLFDIVNRLYGLSILERNDIDVWSKDVRFFEIRDENKTLRGQFYLDLFSRPHKRGGAWMDECHVRCLVNGQIQTPVAYLVCNFTPPADGKQALLTHDDVTTLFHEFGHGLHHLLTKVDYSAISGINGVEWDAIELPSQFMENWCWQKESVQLISGHVKTGEPLPDSDFKKLQTAKNFQTGMKMIRQLEFAQFDFLVHMMFDPTDGGLVKETLDRVRRNIAVIIPPAFNRFAHSFSHIFSGGYAAGFYSYLWAEVLAADAYELFEENGTFDPGIGRHFLNSILERGGSRDAMQLFVEFRGRPPCIKALLRQNGIEANVVGG